MWNFVLYQLRTLYCIQKKAIVFIVLNWKGISLLCSSTATSLIMSQLEFVRAIYAYAGEDQSKGLMFPVSAILLVVERADDGWCKGYASGRQGWFPSSYTKALGEDQLVKVKSRRDGEQWDY